MLNALIGRLRDEPVLVATVVSALLVVLVTVGIPVPDGLDKAVSGLIIAVGALIARRSVSPTNRQ